MSMKITDWELSNIEPVEEVPLSQNEHLLYIENATIIPVPETTQPNIMKIKFKSLSKDGEGSLLSFFLRTKDGMDYNRQVIGTLNTLKRALRGPEYTKGILLPDDMLHGVVKANVVLSNPREYNGEVRQFPNIYEFRPISKFELDTIASLGFQTQEQYSTQ